MNLRPSSKSCCMIWNPARLRRKSSLLHFHAILTDLQKHTSILRYNRTPGSKMRFFQWNVSCCSSRCPFHSVSTTINICSSAEKRNRCRVNEHPGVQPNLTPACCVHCSLPPQSRWRCWSACDLWWECTDNAFNAFSVFLLIYLWSNPLKSHLQVLIPIALLLLSFPTLFFSAS